MSDEILGEASIRRINFPALGEPVGPYRHAVSHGGLLYVSGLSAFGSAAEGASLPEQADVVLGQLAFIAEESGSSLENLLKVTLYVTALEGLPELRTTLFRHYGAHLPASTVVQVQGLFAETINIEIEAIIALP